MADGRRTVIKNKVGAYKSIHDTKFEHYRNLLTKLINPATTAKTYWSILKTSTNGKRFKLYPFMD